MRLAASPARQPPLDPATPGATGPARQLTGHLRRARGLAVDPADIFLFPSVSNALRAVAVTCGLAGQPVAFEDPGYAKARLALARQARSSARCPSTTTASRRRTCAAATGPATSRRPTSSRSAAGCRCAAGPTCSPGPAAGRARAGRRLRRRVPLRRAPAEPAAQHARRRRARGLPGHQLEDLVPRAAGLLGRAARQVPRRDGRLPGRLRRGGQPGLGRVPGQLHRHRRADPPPVPGHAHLPGPAGALRRRLPEHIPAARALGIEAGLHVALVFGRPLDDEAAAARLADAGLACLPLSPFCAGAAARSGLLCGYSRLPETMAQGAAALIGRVTS